MKFESIGLASFALLLAACGNDPKVTAENASAAEVAAKVEAAGGSESFVRPGLWRSTVTIEDVSMPGMPPQMAEQVKGAHGRPQVSEQCLTPDQVKRPKEDFFAAKENCRYERFAMGNGRVDAVMNCADGGGSQRMTMAGTYAPESYAMQMRMEAAERGGEAAGMTMKMRVDARRVGDCRDGQG